MLSPPRPQLSRTPTWPPTVRIVADGQPTHDSDERSMSAAPKPKPSLEQFSGDDLDDHPEDHFLSPMYEYEDWASDSEDDDEIEWDAGITDFALFDNDRRHAQERHETLGGRWEAFMSSQASAFERAVERTQAEAKIDTTRPPLPMDEIPALTPDHSPKLRDDLEEEPAHLGGGSRSSVPSYLTVTVSPPSPDESSISEDDELPLSFYIDRSRQKRQAARKLERPGLRHARTLSGKVHVWRRPSWHIYRLPEDPDAERKAEIAADAQVAAEDDVRGRQG